jgi:hypothetical protein
VEHRVGSTRVSRQTKKRGRYLFTIEFACSVLLFDSSSAPSSCVMTIAGLCKIERSVACRSTALSLRRRRRRRRCRRRRPCRRRSLGLTVRSSSVTMANRTIEEHQPIDFAGERPASSWLASSRHARQLAAFMLSMQRRRSGTANDDERR